MPMQTNHTAAAYFRVQAISPSDTVSLMFQDQPMTVPAGISVAAALLLNGVQSLRITPVRGAARAPYCMMGVCFDCLVEIDGVPNRQACLVTVREGMRVRCQEGAADAPVETVQVSQGEARGT